MVLIVNYDDNGIVVGATREDGVSGGLEFIVDCHFLGMIITYKTSAELYATNLITAKDKKLVGLKESCEVHIIGGFPSSALGSEHWYQSERDDQLNLIGAVADGADGTFKSGIKDIGTGVITWNPLEPHSIVQLKQVLSDGKAYKQAALTKFYGLKSQVLLSTTDTIAKVEAIVW